MYSSISMGFKKNWRKETNKQTNTQTKISGEKKLDCEKNEISYDMLSNNNFAAIIYSLAT